MSAEDIDISETLDKIRNQEQANFERQMLAFQEKQKNEVLQKIVTDREHALSLAKSIASLVGDKEYEDLYSVDDALMAEECRVDLIKFVEDFSNSNLSVNDFFWFYIRESVNELLVINSKIILLGDFAIAKKLQELLKEFISSIEVWDSIPYAFQKEFVKYQKSNKRNKLNKILIDKKIEELELKLNETDLKEYLIKVEQQVISGDMLVGHLRSQSEEVEKEADIAKEKISKQASEVAQVGIAKDYMKRSVTEKATADWLRRYSVIVMFFAVAVVFYTVWEVLQAKVELSWIDLLGRISLSLFISVPAAYLARESSKHRVQQNAYEQIAMNVDAAHTIIAPIQNERLKHEIIAAMANRIFSNPVGVGNNGQAADPYPINIGEVLMKVLDRQQTSQKVEEPAKPA